MVSYGLNYAFRKPKKMKFTDLDLKPQRMMLHAYRLAIPALGDQPPHDLIAPMDARMNEFVIDSFGKDALNTTS